jgi:hypothetical protein
MFGAASLAQWIRDGGRPQRRIIGHSAKLAWHSYWFELNWRSQVPRLEALPLPEDPVFILGFWRSGTTVLHEILTVCTEWTTPRTWQCFNPATCFLTKAPRRELEIGRPMDQGRIGTLSPQEDEFALLLLGELSAYRAFIDPRRFGECGELLRSENRTMLPRWQNFCRGIAATASGTPLLLKSPGHSFRVPMLRTAFPRARFIWAARQPGELIVSNRRMWRAMMDRYALWDCPEGALEAFLGQALRAGCEVLDRFLDEMPRETLLWVDFEDLRRDPKSMLERVIRFLKRGSRFEMTSPLDAVLARMSIHRGTSEGTAPDVDAAALIKRMDAARERFGAGVD